MDIDNVRNYVGVCIDTDDIDMLVWFIWIWVLSIVQQFVVREKRNHFIETDPSCSFQYLILFFVKSYPENHKQQYNNMYIYCQYIFKIISTLQFQYFSSNISSPAKHYSHKLLLALYFFVIFLSQSTHDITSNIL